MATLRSVISNKNYLNRLSFFIVLFSVGVFGQSKIFFIKDQENHLPIKDVNVTFLSGKIRQSDSDGKIIISDSNINEIRLSHIGYQVQKLTLDTITDTIYMCKSLSVLSEVIVGRKKKNTRLFATQSYGNLKNIMANIGSEVPLHMYKMAGVFIPNNSNKTTFYIDKIFTEPKEYLVIDNTLSKNTITHYNEKYAPFKVNLYTVDTLTGIPLKSLFEKDFVMQLQEGKKFAVVELSADEKIEFPKEGIFVAISAFDQEYYQSLGFMSGPGFENIVTNKKSFFKQYIYIQLLLKVNSFGCEMKEVGNIIVF